MLNVEGFQNICGALHNLAPFYNLKNVKNTHGEVLLLVKLQAEPVTLLKVTLLHGCFSRYLNYTRKASHIEAVQSGKKKNRLEMNRPLEKVIDTL